MDVFRKNIFDLLGFIDTFVGRLKHLKTKSMRKLLLIAFMAVSALTAMKAQDTKFNVTGIVPDGVKTVY